MWVACCMSFNAALLRRADTMDTAILASRRPSPEYRHRAPSFCHFGEQVSEMA